MNRWGTKGSAWSVILAGGEGERLRPFIESWLGRHRPKQYCSFVGQRSLFQHTVDRSDAMTPPHRRITVVAEGHREEVETQLRGRLSGTVMYQPRNCGTAAGVFLGLTLAKARDPDAVVTVFPCDHFVHPEPIFADAVRRAREMASVRKESLVLLGAIPDAAETEYGWIEPSGTYGSLGRFRVREVGGFTEKPSVAGAERALERGALWNTLIVSGTVNGFWTLGWRFLPEMMVQFDRLAERIDTGDERACLEAIYRRMPVHDFSSDILQHCPEALLVVELSDIAWNDWGRPERIRDSLRAIGKEPAFSPMKGDCDATIGRKTGGRAVPLTRNEVIYG